MLGLFRNYLGYFSGDILRILKNVLEKFGCLYENYIKLLLPENHPQREWTGGQDLRLWSGFILCFLCFFCC